MRQTHLYTEEQLHQATSSRQAQAGGTGTKVKEGRGRKGDAAGAAAEDGVEELPSFWRF
jgi:hypothetical protein